VELSLKDLIRLAGHFSSRHVDEPWGHDLKMLWEQARSLIAAIEPTPSNQDLAIVSDLINQLDKIDPESFAFRYPTRRDRHTRTVRPNLAGGLQLNLEVFCSGVEKLASFFEGSRGMLTDYTSEQE